GVTLRGRLERSVGADRLGVLGAGERVAVRRRADADTGRAALLSLALRLLALRLAGHAYLLWLDARRLPPAPPSVPRPAVERGHAEQPDHERDEQQREQRVVDEATAEDGDEQEQDDEECELEV